MKIRSWFMSWNIQKLDDEMGSHYRKPPYFPCDYVDYVWNPCMESLVTGNPLNMDLGLVAGFNIALN